MKNIVLLIFSVSTLACSNNNSSDTKSIGKELSKETFGEKWPLTIEKGEVNCVDNAIIFIANGKTYALNGVAKNIASKKGYKDIEDIWADDEKLKEELMAAGVPEKEATVKLSITPIIDEGSKLCK